MANSFEPSTISEENSGFTKCPFDDGMFTEELGRPSLIGLDLNSSDFLTRESLGILSNSFLLRDSLTREELNKQTAKQYNYDVSPRESLGILNISTVDIGRESLQIFNVRESLIGQKTFSGLLEVKKPTVIKSPVDITISHVEDSTDTSTGLLNCAMLYSESRKFSSTSSSTSLNPSFSFKYPNIPSPILPVSPFDSQNSKLTLSDPLNEAFKQSNTENKGSVSQIITHDQLPLENIGTVKKRIQSLPFTLSEGIHKFVTDELDDSVFSEAKKVLEDIHNSWYVQDTSSESGRGNFLDSIKEPNWPPADLDSSQDSKDAKSNYEITTIQKKIDMIDTKQADELKNNKTVDTSIDHSDLLIKRNPSLLKEVSPGNRSSFSSNGSGNMSKISQSSNESILKMIKNLSDFVKDKDNLSSSRKSVYINSLNSLASEISEPAVSEDSGHSSEEQQIKEGSDRFSIASLEDRANNVNNKSEECHALDLSCKNRSSTCEENKKLSVSKNFSPLSVRKPPPYIPKTPKRNASTTSNESLKKSQNISNNSGNVSQSKVVANKLRKSKVGTASTKTGPLRAVLPLENMAKGAKVGVTPEKNENKHTNFRSSRTSTPIQKMSLKPTQTSTPANVNTKAKDCAISPLSTKPKYYRSFSDKVMNTGTSKKLDKSKETTPTLSKTPLKTLKTDVAKVRRNSVSEGVAHIKGEKTEGPARLKRSFSTGKEPKIMTALSKIRENITSYYQQKAEKTQMAQTGVLTESNKSGVSNLKAPEIRLSTPSMSHKNGKENSKI